MPTQFDEKGKIYTDVITKKPVRVIIQTTTHIIHGDIHLKPDVRIKDALQQGDHFLAVTGAVVFGPDGKQLYCSDFLTINEDHIIWLIPQDELIEAGS